MKKIFNVSLCIILGILLSNITVFADTNLIQNGSFEQVIDNNPVGWTSNAWDKKSGGSLFKVDEGNGNTGSRFVTISNNINNDARFIQKVNVKENKMYRLSCFIRTDHVNKEGAGACISVQGKLETSPALHGTNESWQQKDLYIKTGSGIESITVTVDLGGYGSLSTGTASFDNVTLEEVTSIPANAIVTNISSTTVSKTDNISTKTSITNASKTNKTIQDKSKNSIFLIRIFLGLVILFAFYKLFYYIYTSIYKNKIKLNVEKDKIK